MTVSVLLWDTIHLCPVGTTETLLFQYLFSANIPKLGILTFMILDISVGYKYATKERFLKIDFQCEDRVFISLCISFP